MGSPTTELTTGRRPARSVLAAFRDAQHRQGYVIKALVLRDMRSRFGRNYLGYLIAILWPLSHLAFISLLYSAANRIAPTGGDPMVFVSTGVMPYILCLYPSRLMTFAIFSNKNLLQFPIVKSLDLVLARGILEVLTAFCVVAAYAACLLAMGVDIQPLSDSDAVLAICATVYFSLACGLLNAIVFMLWPSWQIAYIIIIIIMYGTAGTFIQASVFPENVRDYIWYNPLLHCVEWLRLGYYEDSGESMLSRTYLITVSTIILVIGLALERAVRGKFLQAV